MTSLERDGFYEAFWVTPELPTPHMKADILAAPLAANEPVLSAEMADMRLMVLCVIQVNEWV